MVCIFPDATNRFDIDAVQTVASKAVGLLFMKIMLEGQALKVSGAADSASSVPTSKLSGTG